MNIGLLHIAKEDFTKAHNSFGIADSIFRKYDARSLINFLKVLKSRLYVKMGKRQKAITLLTSQAEMANASGFIGIQLNALRELTKVYEEVNDFERALNVHKEIEILEKKKERSNPLLKIKDTEIVYRIEQKKKELALQTSNYQLVLSNQRKEFIIYLVLGVFFFTSLLAYFYFQRQKLRLQKQLLNQEVDSLRYRISQIVSDIKLDDIEIPTKKLKTEIPNKLTDREVQVLSLAVTNKSNAEIAEELHLSVNTVKYHLKNIYSKLGVSNRLEARNILHEAEP
jgi:ATP/maltotriose-dependent transcriptional regulator MalT